MIYRPEIDGLRALAVLPVIFYHAGFELFGGGFVGVDVFFVISGYLITSIIINDIENSRFSIINFYERRVRRILPALLFMMFVCIPFAYMWMLPSMLKDFSQSLIAVSFFVSNILFWRKEGYFGPSAEENPMLHTWSLAIEEQYYFLFPIFLLFAWRYGKDIVFWLITILIVISLLLSEWGWRNHSTANFFLAPTRAWELLCGSIAAFIVDKKGVQKSNTLTLLGLAAIIYSIFVFDKNIPYPSIYTLVPVLGVVFLILYGNKNTLVAKLLSIKILVGIGLISYSAYLWHQPLFAFARIRLLYEPSIYLKFVLLLTTFIIAMLSWKYIEKPFRDKSLASRKHIFLTSFMCILIISIFGSLGHIKKGYPERIIFEELEYYGMLDQQGIGCFNRVNNFCNQDDKRKKIILIGDSTIEPLATSLQEIQKDFAVVPITAAGCILIKNFSLYNSHDYKIQYTCLSNKVKSVLKFIETEHEPIIVYGGMLSKVLSGHMLRRGGVKEPWHKKFVTNDNIDLRSSMEKTVIEIAKKSSIVFLLEFPEFGVNAQSLLLKSSLYSDKNFINYKVEKKQLLEWHKDGHTFIKSLSQKDSIIELDVFTALCNQQDICSPFNKNKQMYTDIIHPSEHYSDEIAKQILIHLSEKNLSN